MVKAQRLVFSFGLFLLLSGIGSAQGTNSQPKATSVPAQSTPAPSPAIEEQKDTTPPKKDAEGEPVPPSKQQPKRILGLMPNYRAVSAGAIPPPPTPEQAFKIATLNSFDYSSFVFVGITSAFAEWSDARPAIASQPYCRAPVQTPSARPATCMRP